MVVNRFSTRSDSLIRPLVVREREREIKREEKFVKKFGSFHNFRMRERERERSRKFFLLKNVDLKAETRHIFSCWLIPDEEDEEEEDKEEEDEEEEDEEEERFSI